MQCVVLRQGKNILASMKSDINHDFIAARMLFKKTKEDLSHSFSDEGLIASLTNTCASKNERIVEQSKEKKDMSRFSRN